VDLQRFRADPDPAFFIALPDPDFDLGSKKMQIHTDPDPGQTFKGPKHEIFGSDVLTKLLYFNKECSQFPVALSKLSSF
jgi:hypothetical protein